MDMAEAEMVMEKIGLIQGSGYGSFPGQTFNGGGGGNGYGGGRDGHGEDWTHSGIWLWIFPWSNL